MEIDGYVIVRKQIYHTRVEPHALGWKNIPVAFFYDEEEAEDFCKECIYSTEDSCFVSKAVLTIKEL